ncbi:MAG: MBL fold metallo-hydrolase [Candidatus Methanofastidiosia archaeon]|jgi:glyoxylase-like metal-dependent hydrolase (beta-lactamase superfamily II)
MATKVSDHVYCRIGKNGDSNNGVIICDTCSIVIDTATDPDQTTKDLGTLKKTTNKKIKYLINTHYHGDHTLGNMYFSDIIAHKSCYTILKERTPVYLEYIKEEMEPEKFKKFSIKLPTITFTKELSLYQPPLIVVTHHGGHTVGSSTVYIPEDKVLFSGDLLFVGYHPYMGDANIPKWISALQELQTLDITQIIPGHGEICDKQELETHIKYLNTFHANLRNLKETHTKKELIENPNLLELPDLGDKERIATNIEAQYEKV